MAKCCNNHENHEPESLKREQVAVVMVPFPAQGHLNQLLQLACLVSSYGLQVHYVGSAIHIRQAKLRAHGLNPMDLAKIQFHDIPTPEFPSPPPNPNASLKFPAHLQPSWDATFALSQPVFGLLRDISSKARRVVIIHDTLMAAVVQDAASMPNAEAYIFTCTSAFILFFAAWQAMGKPPLIDAAPKGLPNPQECFTEEVLKFAAAQANHLKFQVGRIHNTSRVLEGTYLDLLAREEFAENKKQWAIGPILPVKLSPAYNLNSNQNCLEWLDKQPPKSVVYVSFGTTTSMSDEEVKELAIGLEESKQKFIWVLRDADKGDIFDGELRKLALPEGFEERTEGNGIIIRDWAPQPEILAHPATGGFMSHCGWNSCIESITMGVPIAAWPMHSDQPWNTLLITEVLKIGVIVREWARRAELVASGTIASSLKTLMASQEGNEMRKRSEELGDAVRRSIEEGGVSRLELESFVAHIAR